MDTTTNPFSGFLDGLFKAVLSYFETFLVKLVGGLFTGSAA